MRRTMAGLEAFCMAIVQVFGLEVHDTTQSFPGFIGLERGHSRQDLVVVFAGRRRREFPFNVFQKMGTRSVLIVVVKDAASFSLRARGPVLLDRFRGSFGFFVPPRGVQKGPKGPQQYSRPLSWAFFFVFCFFFWGENCKIKHPNSPHGPSPGIG